MNIYWFRIFDDSYCHAILAPDEKTAREIFPSVEKDYAMSSFRLAGVSENVNEGKPRALAVISGDSTTEIYK